ncbi:flagellar basal body P-ring formation chaperone FlgA [Pantoea vagans]|uniref:flagellar basal body P-ring formation chaperone FlgA n=1 Tax=Pantoea vagans TaxID=470934 RepID=UPI003FA38C86
MAKQLIQIINVCGLILMLAVATISHAETSDTGLMDQITRLLNNTINLPPSVRPSLEIKLLTPIAQRNILCEKPVLSLSGNPGRVAGQHTIIAQCDAQRRFLQIEVNATGTWFQATRQIQRGETVTQQDIQPRRGALEHLPAGLILDVQKIIGRVALRAIHPGENLVEGQLRHRWVINSGDKVDVSYLGAGFRIITAAKALDNAALGQRLRLKTASGQILNATATGDSKATVGVD